MLFDKIDAVYDQYITKVGTGELNRAITEIIEKKPPPETGRGRFKLYYATQIGIKPPTFALFVNQPDKVHFSYERFLVNQIRTKFGLDSTPIGLMFKGKKRETRQKYF